MGLKWEVEELLYLLVFGVLEVKNEKIDKNGKNFMHWNVALDALPGSKRLVHVLDCWLNDWQVVLYCPWLATCTCTRTYAILWADPQSTYPLVRWWSYEEKYGAKWLSCPSWKDLVQHWDCRLYALKFLIQSLALAIHNPMHQLAVQDYTCLSSAGCIQVSGAMTCMVQFPIASRTKL